MSSPTFTKCWDCIKSTNGGCSWSEKLQPVDGWVAIRNEEKESYHVIECPEFERDTYGSGMYRIEQEYMEAVKKHNKRFKGDNQWTT